MPNKDKQYHETISRQNTEKLNARRRARQKRNCEPSKKKEGEQTQELSASTIRLFSKIFGFRNITVPTKVVKKKDFSHRKT